MCSTFRYTFVSAIRGFKSGALKRFYNKDDARKLPQNQLKRIGVILDALDGSTTIAEIGRIVSLHPLTGNRKGVWSVKVTANWRIAFRFENGEAYDIDWEDYR